MGPGEVDHEHEFAVRIPKSRRIRPALVQFPDASENVGVDRSLGDQPFRAEPQFVQPAKSPAGAEDTPDRRFGREQSPRASDDVACFLLDVAEVGEVFGEFDQQVHGRDRPLVGHSARRLDEDGPFRDRSQGLVVLAQISFRFARVRRSRNDRRRRQFLDVFGKHEHFGRVPALHAQAQRGRAQLASRLGEHLHALQLFVGRKQVDAVARLRPDHARTPTPVDVAGLAGQRVEVHGARGGEGRRQNQKRSLNPRVRGRTSVGQNIRTVRRLPKQRRGDRARGAGSRELEHPAPRDLPFCRHGQALPMVRVWGS